MYVKTNSECVIKPHLHSPQMNNSGDILMIKLKIAIFKKIMMKRYIPKLGDGLHGNWLIVTNVNKN